jgi:predicted PurR-regulated permease PerM
MISPLTGLATLAWAIIVQQIENNFLVPKMMKQAAGVNPVITLLTLAIGYNIAGVAGAVLAIPTYIAFESIVSEFFSSKTDKKRVSDFVR